VSYTGQPLALCVDLGGTKTLSAAVTPGGQVIARDLCPTPTAAGVDSVMRAAVDSLRRVFVQAGLSAPDAVAVGLAMPGISDPEKGIVYSSPNLPDWHNVPVAAIFREEFKLPSFVINDANAAAFGELYYGAARGVGDFVYVTISTGIGGGIVAGGKLYTGSVGLAGELGHMTVLDDGPDCPCGSKGCWEMMASGTALGREARRRISDGEVSTILAMAGGDIERVTAVEVHRAYRQGDLLAIELVKRAAYYLGVGLANIVNIFNPEMVVVGGGLMAFGEALLGPAREMVTARAYPEAARVARIVTAGLGGRLCFCPKTGAVNVVRIIRCGFMIL
jgi:glucokinase